MVRDEKAQMRKAFNYELTPTVVLKMPKVKKKSHKTQNYQATTPRELKFTTSCIISQFSIVSVEFEQPADSENTL